jgi:hypothetical protein
MFAIALLALAAPSADARLDLAAERFQATCVKGRVSRSTGIRELAKAEVPMVLKDRHIQANSEKHFGFSDSSGMYVSVYRWADPSLAYHTVCSLALPGREFDGLFFRLLRSGGANRANELDWRSVHSSWRSIDYLEGQALYRLRSNWLGKKHIFIEASIFTPRGRAEAANISLARRAYAAQRTNYQINPAGPKPK